MILTKPAIDPVVLSLGILDIRWYSLAYIIGFIVGSKNIYLTTSHGRLIIIDITTGKPTSVIKIDNDKISRPFVLNKNLFIIKDNAIIKLD